MFKRFILLQAILFHILTLNAQQSDNIRLKVEGGILWDTVDGKLYLSGPFLNIEPRLNISRNVVLGMMLEGAINTQRILTNDPSQYQIDNEIGSNQVFSIGPVFDYYFSRPNCRPYLGLGLIHSFLTTTKKGFNIDNPLDAQELNIDNQIGILLRTGIYLNKVKIGQSDLSRFILGLKFNYIPKADIRSSNGQKTGTIVTSNISLSIAHIFGDVRD